MAHRIGPTPQLSQPRSNSEEDLRALALQMFKDSVDLRSRLLTSLPTDGTEGMTGPLPLVSFAKVDLPTASLWKGAIVYVSDEDLVYFSDGTSWRRVAGNSPEVLASGSASGTTITFTSIPQDFSGIHLQLNGVSSDTATRHLQVQGSIDNGSTWNTTASDYIGFTVIDTGTLAVINEATLVQTADVAAVNVHTVGITLQGYANSGHMTAIGRISNGTNNYSVQCTLAKAAPLNALRVIWNGSGNFDAGTYILSGIF